MIDEEEGGAANVQRRSVYEEVWDAIRFNIWIYFMVELRAMAEKSKLKGDADRILMLPMTLNDILSVVTENMETCKGVFGAAKTEELVQTMNTFKQGDDKARESDATTQESEIVVFDDDYQESECVYSIAKSVRLQTVIVILRGSVTLKDFKVDMQGSLRDIPNVLYETEPNQPEFLGVHFGFQGYLYGQNIREKDKDTRKGKKRRPASNSKLPAMFQRITTIMEANPGYNLAFTGHSLGGALAIICSLEAAGSEDPRIPKPVTCISIGSPKVGNMPFRLAVETMERQGTLRLLRVANSGDIVPLVPQEGFNPCRQ